MQNLRKGKKEKNNKSKIEVEVPKADIETLFEVGIDINAPKNILNFSF